MSNEQILQEVLRKTNSELIIFFVIVAIVLVVFFIPLYSMMRKDRKERISHENMRQDKYIEREKEIIRVITANTEVIAGLKTTLEMTSTSTNNSFTRIQDCIDRQNALCLARNSEITRIQVTLDEVSRNINSTCDDVHKVLMIVDNIPQTGNVAKGEAIA